MTYLLLAVFVSLVLSLDVFLHHRRRRVALAASRAVQLPASRQPPPDAYFHPGHTWVRLHSGDLASIGVSEFASNFAGQLASIELPAEGRRLNQAERAGTLVSRGNRRLDLAMPIDGQVLAVNRELLDQPHLAQQHPYDRGWLLRVRPSKAGAALSNLLPARAARAWLDASRTLIARKLEPSIGAVLNDGGEFEPAFGERLTDEAWSSVQSELFPVVRHARS